MDKSKNLPMVDYTIKMMLLEAIHCYKTQNDNLALRWLEHTMFNFNIRIRELRERDRRL